MTPKKTAKKGSEAEEKQSFEKSLERLEKIVEEMEGGSLSLEDMIGRFEEGQGLLKFCSKKLNEVERKIEILVKKGDGVTAEPFDGEAGGEAGDGGEADGSAGETAQEGELF